MQKKQESTKEHNYKIEICNDICLNLPTNFKILIAPCACVKCEKAFAGQYSILVSKINYSLEFELLGT
jgi:hypothetical protein